MTETKKGAAIGGAAGAAGAVIKGEREADEILAGAAIGAAAGAGVGAYMDRQEERLARNPGTTVERVDDGVLLVKFDSDVLFDVDSALAALSRRRLRAECARGSALVIGTHYASPCAGHIVAEGAGFVFRAQG